MNIVKQLVGRKISALFDAAKTCSTRPIGNAMFVCRVSKPTPRYCEHSLSMGDGFICNHPDRQKFAE